MYGLPLLISREQALSRGGVAKLGTNLKTKSSGAKSISEYSKPSLIMINSVSPSTDN